MDDKFELHSIIKVAWYNKGEKERKYVNMTHDNYKNFREDKDFDIIHDCVAVPYRKLIVTVPDWKSSLEKKKILNKKHVKLSRILKEKYKCDKK